MEFPNWWCVFGLLLAWLLSDTCEGKEVIFDISRHEDGRTIVINGNSELVKPVLRLRNGERLNLKLENHLDEPTGVHFHGMLLENYVGEGEGEDGQADPAVLGDGVPGVTQYEVGAGYAYWQNMSVAQDTCGTFWYHSHYAVQYGEGLRGPVVVECEKFDSHESRVASEYGLGDRERAQERIITLSDWYKRSHDSIMYDSLQVDGYSDPRVDGSLFNGKQDAGQVVSFPADADYLRLRVLNVANSNTQVLHIANHKLIVIEIDGVLVKPVELSTLTLATGQRYTVLVGRDEKSRSSQIVHGCNKMMGYITKTHILRYESPGESQGESQGEIVEATTTSIKRLPGFSRDELYKVYEPIDWELLPDPESSENGRKISLDYEESSSEATLQKYGTSMYLVNGHTMGDFMNPEGTTTPLLLSRGGENASPKASPKASPAAQPIDVGFGATVDIAINSIDHMRHPWHLHGHHFQVISMGESHDGPLHWDDTESVAYKKYAQDMEYWRSGSRVPMTRDSINIPGRSYAVIRFATDSPGLWMLHCHVDWHMVKGLGVVLQEGLDKLPMDIVRVTEPFLMSAGQTQPEEDQEDQEDQDQDQGQTQPAPSSPPAPPGPKGQSSTTKTKVLAIYGTVMLLVDVLLYKLFV